MPVFVWQKKPEARGAAVLVTCFRARKEDLDEDAAASDSDSSDTQDPPEVSNPRMSGQRVTPARYSLKDLFSDSEGEEEDADVVLRLRWR